MPYPKAEVRATLAALPDTACRPEFGAEAYAAGGVRFAAVTDTSLVIHLPPGELIEALRSGLAKPFISMGAAGRRGWVEMSLAALSPEAADPLIVAAHAAATHARHRPPSRRPARARRTRAR